MPSPRGHWIPIARYPASAQEGGGVLGGHTPLVGCCSASWLAIAGQIIVQAGSASDRRTWSFEHQRENPFGPKVLSQCSQPLAHLTSSGRLRQQQTANR